MKKIIDIAYRGLGYLMLLISLHWAVVAILWLGYISLGYDGFLPEITYFVFFSLLLGISWKYFDKVKAIYQRMMAHKWQLTLLILVFQVILLLSTEMMIRSDAAVVFKGAFEILEADSISAYLTRNPNNLFLFLYQRLFYRLFGAAGLWLLQGLNIVYAHLAGFILYRTGQKFWGQSVADGIYSFYALLILLTPKFMAMYSDIMSLPLLALQLYLVLAILTEENVKHLYLKLICLGFLTALAITLRPTGAIVVIALFIILFFKKRWQVSLTYLLLFGMSFSIGLSGLLYQKQHQTEVTLIKGEGLEKNLLTFINLGLTFSGTNQADMQAGLRTYLPEAQRDVYNNGRFKNEHQIAEIKRRLRAYTPVTFTLHTLYKQSLTVGEGNLNWVYKAPHKEKTSYISPLFAKIGHQAWARFFRHAFIYTDQASYQFYDLMIQSVWIVALYKEKSLVLGKQVSFTENQVDYRGLAVDITETGELIVLLPDQSQKILSSGEISLTSW